MEKTPMWAPGSNAQPGSGCQRAGPANPRGFTLLELLLVLGIVAMVSAGVAFALRDSSQTQLEREAQRLVALLEAARAQSRATGVPVYWQASPQGFEFVGLPLVRPAAGAGAEAPDASATSGTSGITAWLAEGISVRDAVLVTLGPEPIIERQQIILLQADQSLRIATDGLHGFAVAAAPADGNELAGTGP